MAHFQRRSIKVSYRKQTNNSPNRYKNRHHLPLLGRPAAGGGVWWRLNGGVNVTYLAELQEVRDGVRAPIGGAAAQCHVQRAITQHQYLGNLN